VYAKHDQSPWVIRTYVDDVSRPSSTCLPFVPMIAHRLWRVASTVRGG